MRPYSDTSTVESSWPFMKSFQVRLTDESQVCEVGISQSYAQRYEVDQREMSCMKSEQLKNHQPTFIQPERADSEEQSKRF